ncbi:2-keto-4-pentenoate hydratase/2-oxohepta-3-ene-1,7-dioic acid hydratase (catechol pathway) [Duganella sp. CF517]|uniref:fumarylacetoacetate hydrolase family protein n=1 Tax=Duganella sp. CF517 TaxID=1881038 RepID=UPI0008C8B5B6|nr:fumarylacetoacetate hydrolase family protein [Duganella sp. CF517]SEN06937.1 2-keto-4-pentenoate hydratase/2-oxohepta-3-ene-1,7-dioic acid hydratase (catechol pathway) [Duganella sp. CF517]
MFRKRTAFPAACAVLAALLASAPVQGQTTANPGPSQARVAAKPAPGLAPMDKAHTFSQVLHGDKTSTLLVTALNGDTVSAIDLSEISELYSADAFDVIGRFDAAALTGLARRPQRVRTYAVAGLLGVGPRGVAHIAAGTNYPAHGAEVGHEDAFLFPKISAATGPRSTIVADADGLLDYEVEVCARFDRELRSVADFDAARKGLFLCGDFSDRATLVKKINLRDVGSGDGFPDAKSGPDRFPAGALLVVPRDWKSFLVEVDIATYVNGERRQYARAGDMLKDLRSIVGETLDGARTRTWLFKDGRIPMVGRAAIDTGSAVLTGTGEGVVFKKPGAAVMKSVMQAKGRPGQLAALDRYVKDEIKKRIYLQTGDRVVYGSNYLGTIETDVVAAAGGGR